MCDVQAKLVAWLDGEVPSDESGEVERHVAGCAECRCWVGRYRDVSETLGAYCDEVMAAKAPRHVRRWVPVLAGALVAAAVLFLAFPRRRVEPPAVIEPTVTADSPRADETPLREPAARKVAVHRRNGGRVIVRVPQYATPGQPMDTAIQIAIPAEAMFPPGAMPTGMNFIAEMRIAPDGSVKQVRLRQ